MVRGSYRKPVIMTERQPSLHTVPEIGLGKRRYGGRNRGNSFFYRWWFCRRDERYCQFSEIRQLALLYLLSQEPKWNVPLKIWAHRNVTPVIHEIFRLPSDGTVILFMACAGLK